MLSYNPWGEMKELHSKYNILEIMKVMEWDDVMHEIKKVDEKEKEKRTKALDFLTKIKS